VVTWRSVNAQPVYDDDGGLIGAVASFFDITERKRAEVERERLAEESQRQRRIYEAALSNTPDLVYIFDLEHRFIYANEALLRMWGRSREEAIGKNCLELGYEPWHAEMHDREIDQVVATRRPIRGEVPFTGTNGRRVYDYIFVPVLGEDGSVVAVAGSTRDVTERRRTEEELRASEDRLRRSEERFRAFMDNNPAAAWITDVDGCIFYLSETFKKMFRLPSGDVLGRYVHELYPEELARVYLDSNRAAVKAGAPVEAIERGLRPDGSEGVFLIYKFPLADASGRTLVGGVAIDITSREQAEAALRETDRRKDEFLAMLAHELRNPLAAVSNATAILELTSDQETAKWAVEVLARQSKQLGRLIDDLMDVSRISRGKMQLRKERIDAVPVLRRAIQAAQSVIVDKGHSLTTALPDGRAWVEADPARLEQMAVNLLFNAAKYTDPGGRITLDARLGPAGLRIAVGDTGVGIAAEMLSRIFDPFAQVDSSLARSQGGLGIGLTLVKTLAQLHGGSISATSDGLGRGSEFVLNLPLTSSPVAETDPAGHPRPFRSLRILAVDDNLDLLKSMARLLRFFGHEVRTAADGPSALAEARELQPEVILLDIGLPGMDGYQVAEEIKRDPSLRSSRLIAISGYGQAEDRRRTSQAGFDLHLVKPVDFSELIQTLRELDQGDPATGDPATPPGSEAAASVH